jgi:hypothetical protein
MSDDDETLNVRFKNANAAIDAFRACFLQYHAYWLSRSRCRCGRPPLFPLRGAARETDNLILQLALRLRVGADRDADGWQLNFIESVPDKLDRELDDLEFGRETLFVLWNSLRRVREVELDSTNWSNYHLASIRAAAAALGVSAIDSKSESGRVLRIWRH